MKEKRTAIYHFTNKSTKRPCVYKNQLEELMQFAARLGLNTDDVDVFCDKSLKRCERHEFDKFLLSAEDYGALIVKDFYHISKNTMKCMSVMKELQNKDVRIYTQVNGSFSWKEAPFKESLKVASYCCRFGTKNEMKEIIPVQNDILTLFAAKKTNWIIAEQYFDESEYQNDGEQKRLMELIKNRKKYDLILVHNLNNIHWRTANFCKIREKLQLDIYSLQEGFLQYNKGERR